MLALAGCAALPYYAFVSGHPFRIRYMILLITAAAACIGMLVALLPKAYRPAVLLLVLGVLAFERRPLGLTSPMVAEAQWDRANQKERRRVTACLLDGVARRAHPRQHGVARALHAGDVDQRARDPPLTSTKGSARSGTRR